MSNNTSNIKYKRLDCHGANAPRNDLRTVIFSLCSGLLTVFKHLFKHPVTQEYPEKKRVLPERFRGKPVVENCCGCQVCEKVCPSGAIRVIKNGEEVSVNIDLNKCIFCGNCAFYCPKGAVKMSGEYELASSDNGDLKLRYESLCKRRENE